MPLTDTGFVALRTADILVSIQQEYLDITGLNIPIPFESDTVLGVLTGIMADRLGQESELTQAVYDARDPSNSTGVQLSSLSLAVGVSRNDATFSIAAVGLAGDPFAEIPEGRTVRGGGTNQDALWDLTADITLDGVGFASAFVQAREAGEILAGALEINQIVTPVAGWSGVSNAAAVAVGAGAGVNRESDDELRQRRQLSLQISGAASANAIRANLLEIGGVTAAIVVENDEPVSAIIDGLTVDPNSVLTIIHPPTLVSDTDTLKLIAETIYLLLCAGIATTGSDVVTTVTSVDNVPKTISYDFSTTLSVNTAVVVGIVPVSVENPNPPSFAVLQPLVEAAITAYYATLNLGDDVTKLALSCAIAAVEGVQSAAITFTVPADPTRVTAAGDVTVRLNELALEGTTSVTE